MKTFKFDPDRIYVVAEIGINYVTEDGNRTSFLLKALEMTEKAANIGCDFVKFQKRVPSICVPDDQKDKLRECPWGTETYLEYKERIEFGVKEYDEIDKHCKKLGIQWTASPWDEPSVEFLLRYSPPFLKLASASITDTNLLKYCAHTGVPLVVSTGMANINMIRKIVLILLENGADLQYLLHCTSTYPAPLGELNLSGIQTLQREFPQIKIGYSGHEKGIPSTVLAIGMGATFIERHFTLDRTMWGSDQSASIEPEGMRKIVQAARIMQQAKGDGRIVVSESEKVIEDRLRRVKTL